MLLPVALSGIVKKKPVRDTNTWGKLRTRMINSLGFPLASQIQRAPLSQGPREASEARV